MAQLVTVRLSKADQQPLGFRLQGGKDFGTPLVVQKVNGGSAAERAGLQAGDALLRVNSAEVYALRHQEAQDAIRAAGGELELTVQRGGNTWRPSVTPTGSLPRPGSRLGASPAPVTSTSLKANQQPSRAFGSGHNNVAKPFGYTNGNDGKSVVNKQYNTPVNMYSEQTIAETLSAQTEVLAGGVLGVNFKKNEKTYDAEKSAVYKVLQEEQNDPEPESAPVSASGPPVSGLRSVAPPEPRSGVTGGLPPGQNICEECERLITGVFVRIKDKNLHVECFKCATCGSSLKNQGYYNLNGKLYCDIHAKLVARAQPPAAGLEPVTVPPGGRIPTNAYSTPLPPLSTTNYSNGSSAMFSPSSNVSGPKPFGSSLGSAYSPSLSPRSAPMSPARPSTGGAAYAPAPAYAPAHAPAYAPAPAPAYAPAPTPAYAPAPAPAYAPAPAPAAPFAPTNESSSRSILHKTEYKSPAEERLIKKMAKMALNGYEIGIQRKIKPAGHIQSMADKIQDTVVAKHPLNSDVLSSSDSSRESSVAKSTPLTKSSDKISKAESIQSIGDKIKETLLAKHPMVANGGFPIPPPLPDSPVPILNASTPVKQNLINNINNQNGFLKNHQHNNKLINNNEKVKVDNGYATLPNKTSPFLNGQSLKPTGDTKFNGNTLNGRKTFEKTDQNTTNSFGNISKIDIKDKTSTLPINDTNTRQLNKTENGFKKHDNDSLNSKPSLPNNLYDNSVYTYKVDNNQMNGNSNGHNKHEDQTENKLRNGNVSNEELPCADSDQIVRRRPKKADRDTEGKRDSHIIARPLSTMTSLDVADGQYPVCHVCDKTINRGPFITALGRIWCPDHFLCVNTTCRRPLQDIGFVEENGQLYCEYCFEQYIAPACDKCHAKIKGDCLNAIGKHFHPECFNCVYCGKLFGNNPFFLEDGLPYCEADWNELFTTKCFACGFPVEAGDRWVEALNNNYHSQCFNCTVCKKNLEGQSFFAKGGRPFCKMHAR